MPHWTSLVLMTNGIYWQGETYFVDGLRYSGLLTRFLPVVEGGIGCSRTRLAREAIVDLRLLRNPPPPGGTRVIGYVKGPGPFTPTWVRPGRPAFASGAQMHLTGPGIDRTVFTDFSGVYELDDLPPGDYTLRISVPDTQVVGYWKRDESTAEIHLDSQRFMEVNCELSWNGRIEGQVRDDAGRPVQVGLEVLGADGRQLPGNVDFFHMSEKDGSYRFGELPPGRYIVAVNPNGPRKTLQLAPGQRVTGVDFRVQPPVKP